MIRATLRQRPGQATVGAEVCGHTYACGLLIEGIGGVKRVRTAGAWLLPLVLYRAAWGIVASKPALSRAVAGWWSLGVFSCANSCFTGFLQKEGKKVGLPHHMHVIFTVRTIFPALTIAAVARARCLVLLAIFAQQ